MLSHGTDSIFKRADIPRIVVGFMGPSGSGKTSVINAIIGEEDLLPSNCSEACTAVPVEICYNYYDDVSKAYKAEIEFITAEEWTNELDMLITDVTSLEPRLRGSSHNEDVRAAWDKIKAVYPNITIDTLTKESAKQLILDPTVLGVLGKRQEIVFPKAQVHQFTAKISSYIDSSPRSKIPLWPLVKLVRLFVRSEVLSTGLVLVDLPGSGDVNSARELVSENYMQEVSAICIVANINRALTNAVAKKLFGRGDSLKRRLLMDGLLNEDKTFFVLTMTDNISNQQTLDRHGTLREIDEVKNILEAQIEARSKLEAVTDRIETLNGRLRARKRKWDESIESSHGMVPKMALSCANCLRKSKSNRSRFRRYRKGG
jgi:GTPase SAR1 family protein